jgi:Holliday junction resolvase
MINNTKTPLDEKIKSLADKYVSEGFQVLIKPKTDELPFNLDNYQPDIIATKNNSGLVIEIRTSFSRISVERLQALAEKVNMHPGWHFLLVTLEDIEAKSLPGISEQLPSWEELTDRLFQAHKLIENDEIEPAFLYMWSIFEGALRKRAIDVSIPIERFPVIGLLRHLYSLGELSISQFDLAQACFEVRNHLAHGYIENLTLPVVHNFDNLVRELLTEWKVKLAISQLSSEDLAAFRAWFAEFDATAWDKQIEKDVAAGRLDELAEKALKHLREGRCTDL